MNEWSFRIVAVLLATGIFGFVHWTISKHLKGGSETKIVLSLECIVVLCLVGAFVKGEILEVAGAEQVHPKRWDDMLYLFAVLVTSMLIYRVFAWGRK
jgi:hypothetical protein